MTTTGMYQGLQGDRNSSRVLGPPGGASSDIFGTGPVAPKPQPKAARDNDIFGGPAVPEATPPTKKADTPVAKPVSVAAQDSPSKQKAAPAAEEHGHKEVTEAVKQAPVQEPKRVSVQEPKRVSSAEANNDAESDQKASPSQRAQTGNRKNQATYNPITGEEIKATGAAGPHTSTRVAHPPGGHQTKLW